MDPSGPSISVQIGFLVFLTFVNAFLASAEAAFVSSNKNKIKIMANEGNKKAQLLQDLLEEPTKLLSTIQVAVTFLSLLASASAAMGLSDDLEVILKNWNVPYSQQIAVICITVLLGYITLVFGSLVPKRLAMQNAETIALRFVRPVSL
ncbi:MAG: DUF21 domain-containing protein, partial [Firmicutes bacterium]|nr:DUF21 domain-containing protein [Bacillota bacterium]